MFPGSCYGVGVMVTALGPELPGPELPKGVIDRPMRLDEMLPAEALTDEELAREIERATQAEAVIAAYKAERVVQLAARRPAHTDPQPGELGAAAERDEHPPEGVSEFFPDELALIARCSRTAATVLLETSVTLRTRLPVTWAALAEGQLDWPRARAIAQELGWPADGTNPAVLAEVEAALVAVAPSMPVGRLRAEARRELVRRDAAAAERRRKRARRTADVVVHRGADGMAELAAQLPAPVAAACRDTVDRYARMARADGDERPIGQLRAAVLEDLVLRPWDTSRPPVTAQLEVIAPLSSLAAAGQGVADVEGQPITAGHLRELLARLDAVCPGGLQAPTGGSLRIALTDDDGALRAVVGRRELERLVRQGCPAHSDRDCGCAVLDPPPPVDRYRPSEAQRRFVTTRDRTCRHPGCRNRAAWADLDHVLAHADGGATACENLCCLCRRHHRLKTHARGWRFTMTGEGVLTVTTPSGVTRTTGPPRMAGHLDLSAVLGSGAPVSDAPPF